MFGLLINLFDKILRSYCDYSAEVADNPTQ